MSTISYQLSYLYHEFRSLNAQFIGKNESENIYHFISRIKGGRNIKYKVSYLFIQLFMNDDNVYNKKLSDTV